MRIKFDISPEEIRKLGFTKAMNWKWHIEEDLEALALKSEWYRIFVKEVANEIQKKN